MMRMYKAGICLSLMTLIGLTVETGMSTVLAQHAVKTDVESGAVTIETHKVYVPQCLDCDYQIVDNAVVKVEHGIIYPVAKGSTEVIVSKLGQELSRFTLNVAEHQNSVFDQLRHNWENISLANKQYDDHNPQMKQMLTRLDKSVEKHLSKWEEPSGNTTSIFKDIAFTKSSDLTTAYRRLEQMAQVFGNASSNYYHSREIVQKVKAGLKWLYQNHYNEHKKIVGNWWDYEIGVPRAVVNTLIYMYECFSQDEIMQYTEPISKFVPDPSMIRKTLSNPVRAVGGNQTDLSKVTILEGALREDKQRIQAGVNGLTTIMSFVDSGEGFYQDGSFIDHTNVAYTGAYGNVLIEGFSQLLPVIQKTEFALADQQNAVIYDWIEKAFMPIIVRGELMDMTRGRSISRANAQSHVQAMEVLRSLLRLAQTATPERKQQLLEYAKGQMERDTFFDHYEGTKTYKDIDLLNKLLSDDSIKGYAPSDYIAAFNNMDKFVYYSQTHGFTFALSMYSNKTQNYEYMNKENRQGWYTADGMVYLYNGDLSHYSNDYWATVHPYYLPGTTISNELRSDKKPGMVTLKSDFVGATQLGNTLATIGMDFNNWNNTLTARKSWFVLGDKVVFLTTNIKPQSNLAISTIENRKLTNDSYQFYINDQLVDMTKVVITDKTKSFYMTNGNIKESIGYVFLDELQTYGVIDKRQGSWYDVNEGQSKDIVKNSFATLWSVHNQQPSQLAYVMVPNKSREDVQIAANNVAVLEQTQDLQVVYDKGLNVWGIVKYTDTPYTVDNSVQLSSKGMYIVKKQSDGLYDVSFYNPSAQTSAVKVDSVDDTLQVTLTQQPTHAMPSTVWQVTKKDVAKPMEPQDNDTKPSLKPNESSKVKDNTNKSNQNNLNGSGQLQHKQQITPKASYTGANQQANITLNNASVKNDEAVQAVTGDEQSENMTQQSKRHTNDVTTTQSASSTTTAKQPEKDKTNYLMIGGGSVVAILLALWWFISGEKR